MNQNKITICRIVYQFAPLVGGAISHVIELSTQIHPELKSQYIVTPKIGKDTKNLDKSFVFDVERIHVCKFGWLQWIKSKYIRWLPVFPLITLSFVFSSFFRLYRLNRNQKIDIIQAHGIGVASIAAFIIGKLIRKHTVVMMHGTNDAYSPILGRHESIIIKLFPPDHMFVLNDGSHAPEKGNKLLPGRVTVVYHAIDTQLFYPEIADKKLLTQLGISNDFVFLFPHSLTSVKGGEYAIKGFKEFLALSQAKSVKLLIAGEGDQKQNLENLVKDFRITEKVQFLGNVNHIDIVRYFSIANAVLATSTYSNVNRATQEAMACAKPVVVFDSGSTGRLISNMETGVLAEKGNIKDLANKMFILYCDRALGKTIGERARKFIIENRSWENRIKKEVSVYKELLGY